MSLKRKIVAHGLLAVLGAGIGILTVFLFTKRRRRRD